MRLNPFAGNEMERSARSVFNFFGAILIGGSVLLLSLIGGLIWWAVS